MNVKNTSKDFNNELIERFKNTYQFCENDNNKFLMLLRKGIYPYEYMDSWNKFNQDKLPPMNNFYSELTMEIQIHIIEMHKVCSKHLIIKT